MAMHSQKTIRESIKFDGVGLHNGTKVNLCLKPAEVNSGIKFKRTDVDKDKNNKKENEGESEENFASCLGALEIIKDGWETEAIPIPKPEYKYGQKTGLFAKIFSKEP